MDLLKDLYKLLYCHFNKIIEFFWNLNASMINLFGVFIIKLLTNYTMLNTLKIF